MFLHEHLQPSAPVNIKQVARWIADLDSGDFAVRQRAAISLEGLEDLAAPALREKLSQHPSAEVRRQAQRLLEKLDGPVTSSKLLQALRAVEVLEQIGTSDAQKVLKTLAAGAPEARLTQEAQAAMARLQARSK